jgi:pyruvate dehydrogenase E2 component (dihydrolipoyllysine-residue acetyltransferase)
MNNKLGLARQPTGTNSGTRRVADRFERVDFAERWLGDGFRVLQENPPGFLVAVDVEMTQARLLVDALRRRGVQGSYAGVLVRAAGLALSRHPELHRLLVGARSMKPRGVSIGLSVANEAAAAPVLRLEDVADKPLPVVCQEVALRAPQAREEDSRTLAKLRRWGWLLPGWMRRLVLRRLFSSLRFRHLFGSLQVTVLSSVDFASSLVCGAPAVLAMGRVTERVVARGGQPVVRLMATLVCSGDHKVWDGERIGRVVGEVRRILECADLFEELAATVEAEPDGSNRHLLRDPS